MTDKEHTWSALSSEQITNDPINWKEIPHVEKVWGFTGDYSVLSTYSPFEVIINGRNYSNLAFAYETLRFEPHGLDGSMKRTDPEKASDETEFDDYINGGWGGDDIGVMKELLRVKFDPQRFPENASLLLESYDKLLVAVGEPDHTLSGATWGVDESGWGNNELGRLLMELREELEDDSVLRDIIENDERYQSDEPSEGLSSAA